MPEICPGGGEGHHDAHAGPPEVRVKRSNSPARGLDGGDRLLVKSVAERLIHALRMQAKRGEMAIAGKDKGRSCGSVNSVTPAYFCGNGALAPDAAKKGIGGDVCPVRRTRARTSSDFPLCRSFIPVAISAALISLAAYISSGAPVSSPSSSHFWTV